MQAEARATPVIEPISTPEIAPAPRPLPRHRFVERRTFSGRGPTLAALDLGTNNCRLLVARSDGPSFTVIDAFSRVVKLGEGLQETRRLSTDAMTRSIEALSICADRLRKHEVQWFRAVATEACRRASNISAFVDRVEHETGITLDIISAQEEARLAVAGCAPLLDPKAERLLVFDIGGGSTELILLDIANVDPGQRKSLLMALSHPVEKSALATRAAGCVADWVSLPVGVVTLGERWVQLRNDNVQFQAMLQDVTTLLSPFANRINAMAPSGDALKGLQLLGTSGTITTLAGVHKNLARYSRRHIDGLWIESFSIQLVIDRLLRLDNQGRAAIPCIGQDRATNLMSGAAILRAILAAWPTIWVRVADRGLREGLLYGLVDDMRIERRRRIAAKNHQKESVDG
jgi:exopolyphosphatase/guanosine-5'-triphosphate,3'-diphosphate pyrophosphatase